MAEICPLKENWLTEHQSYETDCPLFRKDEEDRMTRDIKLFRLVEEFAEYDISKLMRGGRR
jgi:hypothetical protein